MHQVCTETVDIVVNIVVGFIARATPSGDAVSELL